MERVFLAATGVAEADHGEAPASPCEPDLRPRRRPWPASAKARIASESCVPGASVNAAATATLELGVDIPSGMVLVFPSKRGDRLKMPAWDGPGLVPVCKRLGRAGFAWPGIRHDAMRSTRSQFEAQFEEAGPAPYPDATDSPLACGGTVEDPAYAGATGGASAARGVVTALPSIAPKPTAPFP